MVFFARPTKFDTLTHKTISVISILTKRHNAYSSNMPRFSVYITLACNSLLRQETYSLVSACDSKGFPLCRSRFDEENKSASKTNKFEKSHPVIHTYNEWDHNILVNASPVKRVSQQLFFNFWAKQQDFNFFICKVAQAYFQAESSLNV